MNRRRVSTAFVAVALATTTALAAPGSSHAVGTAAVRTTAAAGTPALGQAGPGGVVTPGLYLVTLDAPPLAAYGEDAAGPSDRAVEDLRGESPANSPERTLREAQDAVLAEIGRPDTVYRYTHALNGFAAHLGSRQVKALRAMPQVVSVERNTRQQLDTVASPDFLGLAGASGSWQAVGGPEEAGEGVVVGVVDSGVWPENPSFAGTVTRSAPAGFSGACAPADQWAADDCNGKIVSARHFVNGYGAANVARAEYLSPRDSTGHGSHVAATIAGNHGVAVSVEGERVGDASGMAPGAQLAVYKACWTAPDPAHDGCATADTVAAIDQALADGVDVLGYSMSGSGAGLQGAVERALANAAASGVFVATTAGNDGPRSGSVAHPSPWVTTVAASTHHRYRGTVEYGDGGSGQGAMLTDRAVPRSRLVVAADAAVEGAGRKQARQCHPGSLDGSLVTQAIVVCDRGAVARTDKSRAVELAGGAGMILANTRAASINADFHAVPTVHVGAKTAAALKDYAERAGDDAWARLIPGGDGSVLPEVPAFSGRGPAPTASEGVLKPDLTAPGVSVVAATVSRAGESRRWDTQTGTSIAAAHVAGLAALLKGEHPTWSAAALKSAMVTTASTIGDRPRPFAEGAGLVEPTRFLDPGLVYDDGPGHAFGPTAWDGPGDEAARTRDLNQPAIAVGSFAGRTRVTRTVTNVSQRPETYQASVSGLRGIDTEVEPSTLRLGPGESATFAVRFAARRRAAYERYARGTLTWTGSRDHVARSPIVLRPRLVMAEAELSAEGESGATTLHGRAGLSGRLDLTVAGPEGATPREFTLAPDPLENADPSFGPGTNLSIFAAPEDTAVMRFDVRSREPGDDLDMYVYYGGELVASATSTAPDERITLRRPEPGAYFVYTNAVSAADGAEVDATLTGWVVSADDPGRLRFSEDPVRVRGARPFEVTASWSGLDAHQRWFGMVGFEGSDEVTYVTVN